jgi:hypothetical protein
MKFLWVLFRILLGWQFLWAFIDKTFGFGLSTALRMHGFMEALLLRVFFNSGQEGLLLHFLMRSAALLWSTGFI